MARRKRYRSPPVIYKDKTHEEMRDLVNQTYKITLAKNGDLLERVYARYPLVSKSEVALVIKTFFEALRDNLILDKVINLTKLGMGLQLGFFHRYLHGKPHGALVVNVATPDHLRNHKDV